MPIRIEFTRIRCGASSTASDLIRLSNPARAEEVAFAKKVIEAIPDGRGVHIIDGKMQDDATYKQCQVMLSLAEMLARKDPELAEAYGLAPASVG